MSKENNKATGELAAIANQQSATLIDSASRAINDIHATLIKDIPRAVLPEAVFKEYFLDYFMHPGNYPDSMLLSKWSELAGGYFNPVDIIDSQGNVLFTAPSAMIPPTVNTDMLSGIDFSSIAHTYNNKKKITTVQANNYLTGILSSVDAAVVNEVHDRILQWVVIFNRYVTVTDNNETAKPVATTGPDIGILDL